jgi:hypothetical protein
MNHPWAKDLTRPLEIARLLFDSLAQYVPSSCVCPGFHAAISDQPETLVERTLISAIVGNFQQ